MYERMVQETCGACRESEQPSFLAQGLCFNPTWECTQASESTIHGPVGLLFCSLSRIGARMDGDCVVYPSRGTVFDMIRDPWQAVEASLLRMFQETRVQIASLTRE